MVGGQTEQTSKDYRVCDVRENKLTDRGRKPAQKKDSKADGVSAEQIPKSSRSSALTPYT